MKQKTISQYSYLIYPYVVEEKEYDEYLLSLLENKSCKLKLWNKARDLELYTYFAQNIRETVFWPFSYSEKKVKELENLDNNFKSKILSKQECTMFEYKPNERIQGKVGDNNIFLFDIDKIDIICFKTGICFIAIKTSIGRENDFSDILNFNSTFRNITPNFKLEGEENIIKIQTNSLMETSELSNIIKGLVGKYKTAKEHEIEDESLLTYSYVCVDKMDWNKENSFNKDEFIKLYKILPEEDKQEGTDEETVDIGEYVKVGFSKQGTGILASSSKIENTLRTPYLFEQEYLYTYLLVLYKELYINKISLEYEKTNKYHEIRTKLTDFTHKIWINDITKDDNGKILCEKWEETLQTKYNFEQLKQNMIDKKM